MPLDLPRVTVAAWRGERTQRVCSSLQHVETKSQNVAAMCAWSVVEVAGAPPRARPCATSSLLRRLRRRRHPRRCRLEITRGSARFSAWMSKPAATMSRRSATTSRPSATIVLDVCGVAFLVCEHRLGRLRDRSRRLRLRLRGLRHRLRALPCRYSSQSRALAHAARSLSVPPRVPVRSLCGAKTARTRAPNVSPSSARLFLVERGTPTEA